MNGTTRGLRKREAVGAFAWLLEHQILPLLHSDRPTIVDAGCGTGSLLLPLAAIFPSATFVGLDYKRGSIDRLETRIDAAGLGERVRGERVLIEEYTGPCDAVLSLHACGGASDAALRLASGHRAPYAVSPCCVGKLSRGPLSAWLQQALEEALEEAYVQSSGRGGGESDGFSPSDGAVADEVASLASATFRLIARWADSAEHAQAASTPQLEGTMERRRRRCKRLVELDRLASMPVGAEGELLRIDGQAMATSGQAELLVGPLSRGYKL